MPDIAIAGLFAPLPRTNDYAAQDYVPVPLTGVQIRVQVVNFIAKVSYYASYLQVSKITSAFKYIPIWMKLCLLIKRP